GAASVTARVKPLVDDTTIEVRLDSETGPVVATISVDATVGEWSDVTADVTGAEGVHDLIFVFHGPQDQRLIEVDNWAFETAEPGEPSQTPTPDPSPTPTPDPSPTPTQDPTATPTGA